MEILADEDSEKTNPIRQATRCRCGIAGLIKANFHNASIPKGVELSAITFQRGFFR